MKTPKMGIGAHKGEMALWRIMADYLFSESKDFYFHEEEFWGCL